MQIILNFVLDFMNFIDPLSTNDDLPPGQIIPHLESMYLNTNTVDNFICPKCNKSFRLLKSLKTHLYIDCGGYRFHCEYCLKPFIRKFDLRRHITSKHHNPLPASSAYAV